MRKLLNVLLVVLLLVTAIACDPDSVTGNDVTFAVSVAPKKDGDIVVEAAETTEKVAYVDVTTWKYTAVKGDDGYTTGETKEEKDLGDGDLTLSLGHWTITVNGYSGENKTYTGTFDTKDASITADTKITVDVKPVEDAEVAFSTTLADAITNAAAGATVTLIKDVTLTEVASGTANIIIEKNLTLDLNTKTLDIKNNVIEIGDKESSCSVKIENGKIASASSGSVFILGYDNALTLNKVTATGTFSNAYSYSYIDVALSSDSSFEGSPSLTITDSEISVSGDYGLNLINVEAAEDEASAIGNTKNKAVITIKKSKLKAEANSGSAVVVGVPAVGTIEDSTISGNVLGPIVKLAGGNHTIKNTTVESTKTSSNAYALQVSGNSADKYSCDAEVTVDKVTLKVSASNNSAKALKVDSGSENSAPTIKGTIVDSTANSYQIADSAVVDITYNGTSIKYPKVETSDADV